ncbi:hypothetical protein M9H77_14207 [Catharanthus roseus]|uniref:Uncharacterized protein n=1 Tax=Catharanthus roseus TaxID=4058 RepID=A0ACC0BMM2_CATRO|nr:hypothetical protein M9H77_14207 [Catharanthus roseus]
MVVSHEILDGLFSSARSRKIKDNNGNMDNGMVAYVENALKSKLKGLAIKGRLLSCSQFVQLVRFIQGIKVEASIGTSLGRIHPIACGRSHPTIAGRVPEKECHCDSNGGILLLNLFF